MGGITWTLGRCVLHADILNERYSERPSGVVVRVLACGAKVLGPRSKSPSIM